MNITDLKTELATITAEWEACDDHDECLELEDRMMTIEDKIHRLELAAETPVEWTPTRFTEDGWV